MGDDTVSTTLFSIVTPTFNRAPMLQRMLRHLSTVQGIQDCEIIVINDGSTDETASSLAALQSELPILLRVITLTNGGPARARNAGVQAATKERIMFLDDDVFPRPDMLLRHWEKLESGYDGSQGILLWHPEISITPLISYIDSRGSQFAFDDVKNPDELGGQYIYTGNFAVRRDLVLEVGGFCETLFDRKLAFSAFEDTVLGYALKAKGARLALTRDAIADHIHHMTEEGYFRREYNVGSGVAQLQRHFPEITRDLGLQKKGRFLVLQTVLLRAVNRIPLLRRMLGYRTSMKLRHREVFLRGYLRYQQEYPPSRQGTQR